MLATGITFHELCTYTPTASYLCVVLGGRCCMYTICPFYSIRISTVSLEVQGRQAEPGSQMGPL